MALIPNSLGIPVSDLKPQVKQIPTPAKIAPVAVESVKPEQVELKKKKK